MDRYWIGLIICAVLSTQVAAANSLTDTARAALNTEIKLNGSSSIIVEYNTLSGVSQTLNTLEGEARTAVIQSLHQQFMSSLSTNTVDNVTESFVYVPGTVMSVNQAQLREVSGNPLVKKIYRNQARRINLQQSIDLVFPNKPASKFSGKGQTVAIIDTGVDRDHSFFAKDGTSRVVDGACYSGGGFTNFREAVTLCPNRQTVQTGAAAGINCTQFSFPGCDHGTHVAGIAAGNDGVASEANIIAIQVFTGLRDVFRRNLCGTGRGTDCVVAFDSDILKGLERVFALRNTYDIAAVNMSLGGGQFSSSCDSENRLVTNIIGQLKLAGIATTASSGNSGFSSQMGWPSCISNAVAVGASSDFTGSIFGRSVTVDERTFYSNNSGALDIYAPGTLIRSSIPADAFANFNGTSMSAPHVAGAFAVVKAKRPSLSVDDIENTFKGVGPLITHAGISRRRLDIEEALKELGLFFSGAAMAPVISLLLDDSAATPPPPQSSSCATEIADGQTKNGAWTASSRSSGWRSGSFSEAYEFDIPGGPGEEFTLVFTINSSVNAEARVVSTCGASSRGFGGVILSAGTQARLIAPIFSGNHVVELVPITPGQTGTFAVNLDIDAAP